MKKVVPILMIVILLLGHQTSISETSDLYQQLIQDIDDDKLDRFSPMEAAFIVSGALTEVELTASKAWFQEVLADIKAKNLLVLMDKKVSAANIFMYFHSYWLKTYEKAATTLLDIQYRKKFNCVSSTVLYNLTCDELGISTLAFETPSHVYTIFSNFDEYVMVENTSSMGFNIMQNLREYSQYLASYYPKNMVFQIGLDRLYAYENSKGREINNTELIGLICYNQAYLAAQAKRFAEAYDYVLLAQKFNTDSRSNEKFEIGLYYRWGNQLAQQKNFEQAFSVFADGVFRYRDNKDFIYNCILSYKNVLQNAWLNKDWELTERIILEIGDLEILTEPDLELQQSLLKSWLQYFLQEHAEEPAQRVAKLLKLPHD